MSLLWRLVFTSRCTSTHHKLALDSLRFLRGPMADLWSNLFLANHEQFLTGSKAPDDTFKDFKNHVLHVEQGFWGGATLTARAWYQKTVTALNQGNWPEAVYNAGVLSHYFTDPFQPFHTDQCEAEGKVHRAAEWSITKSYDELQAILEHDLGGYPQYELPERPDWLEEAIRAGATEAHQSYHLCIDHYDLGRGIKNPPTGLDQEMKDRLAHLIGLASVGFSRVLERAFEEAAVTPPDVAVSLHAFLATLKVPLNWIMKKITDAHERAIVEAIYLEVQEKGKAIDSLPEDEKVVRKLHAQEVLRIPMRQLDAEPARPTGSQYGTGKPARGLTARTSGTAAFERTTISAPLRLNSPSAAGAEPGLESCLMVPLAANNPIDHVADTALRALLSQATTRKAENASSPEAQLTAKWLNRGSLPASVSDSADRFNTPIPGDASAFLPETSTSATNSADNSRRPSPTPLPTRSSDQTSNPKRLASTTTTANAPGPRNKKPRIPADSYPEISPPSPTLATATATLDYTPPASGLDEAMFAPLPPMPRVKPRPPEEKTTSRSAATVTHTPATAQQQSSVVTDTKPPKSVPTLNNPTQRPVPQPGPLGSQGLPTSRISTPAATRPMEPGKPESRAQEQRFAAEKSYSAEPPASPIPVPHIRTDDRPSDDSESEDRQTSAAAVQPTPRIVVSTSQAASQTGHQPINRLANVNPSRPQQFSQARSDTVAARPQNVNFDFQTTAGPTQAGRSDAIQSSLFAALTTPQTSRTEPVTAKPTPAVPQAATSATPTAPRPNMFQRPISPPAAVSSPPAPVTSPQLQPVQKQPVQKQPTQTQPTRPQPAVQQPTVSQPKPVATDPPVQVQPNAVVPPQADSQRQPAAPPENRVPVPAPEIVEQSQPATDAATVQPLPEVEKPAAPQPEAAAPESAITAKPPEPARLENTTPRSARDRRFYLELQSPLKDAPSIGPKTAELFESAGVRTVFDLFRINTDRAAEKLGRPHITAAVLKDWQAQALLVCRVPELRGHDAQYLVACGVRTAEQLANCDPQVLLTHVQTFIATSVGQRLLRGGKIPDLEEVTGWITSGRSARSLRNE